MQDVQNLVQTIVLGAGTGSFDALLALGIVLIYRATGVLNFAQAGTGALGAYVMYSAAQGAPLWLAVPAGLAISAAAGSISYLCIRGIRTQHFALRSAVATLAIAILLQQLIRVFWGATAGGFPAPFAGSLAVGGVLLPYLFVGGLATACLAILAVGGGLQWTRPGTMIRALADNREAAECCGGNVPLLETYVWAIAGVLAGMGAFFQAQVTFDPFFLDPVFVAALIASVVGGLRSLFATFMAALLLEVGHSLFAAYAPPSVAPYTQTFFILLLIAVLALAPRRWLTGPARRAV